MRRNHRRDNDYRDDQDDFKLILQLATAYNYIILAILAIITSLSTHKYHHNVYTTQRVLVIVIPFIDSIVIPHLHLHLHLHLLLHYSHSHYYQPRFCFFYDTNDHHLHYSQTLLA